MIFLRLFLLLTIVPLVELALLIWVYEQTSWQFTLGLIIVTGLVGAQLARMQGNSTWRQIHEELARGRLPSDSLLDAFMIVIAGALLVTPGVLTDLLGFSLLLPAFRRWMKQRMIAWFKRNFEIRTYASGFGEEGERRQAGDNVIDAEVVSSSRSASEDPD